MTHIPRNGSDVRDLWLGLSLTGPQPNGLFLLGVHETLVCETPVDSAEDIVAKIVAATDKTSTIPKTFEMLFQSFLRRCYLCNDMRGRHFEHFL
ncbi:uncharacterized protein TNCV_2363801 [Trichonephila clavipes]|nr:uncharacterized protein TNCV_2363801 [Trichonephila clavipes]